MARVKKAQLKATMAEVDALDLPDGAHWALVHEKLDLEYGDVFEMIADDPEFYGAVADPSNETEPAASRPRRPKRR